MMTDIFISYKHEDESFAAQLEKDLKDAKFDVWRDRRIHLGKDWAEEINQNIRNAFALILLLTPKAVESEYVNYEVAFALGAGVRVIAYMKEKPLTIPTWLNKLHYSVESDWLKLVEELSTLKRIRDARQNFSNKSNSLVQQLMETLRTTEGNDVLRKSIIQSLGHIGNKDAVQTLIDTLKRNRQGQEEIRAAAAEALGLIGDERAIAVLETELKHGTSPAQKSIREACYLALRCIGTDDAINILREYDEQN